MGKGAQMTESERITSVSDLIQILKEKNLASAIVKHGIGVNQMRSGASNLGYIGELTATKMNAIF